MQKLIMRYERNDFSKEVNDHLSNGWKVVPGTMAMTAAGTHYQYSPSGSVKGEISFCFAVTVEKSEAAS